MSYGDAVREFAAQSAEARAETWPVSVKLADESVVAIVKTPTKLSRVQQEQGAGWEQRAIAVFLFPAIGEFVPEIGNEWEVTAYADAPGEIGTRWRCFDLTRTGAGTEHRCVCFRLD